VAKSRSRPGNPPSGDGRCLWGGRNNDIFNVASKRALDVVTK
jgi:hypothetical protein